MTVFCGLWLDDRHLVRAMVSNQGYLFTLLIWSRVLIKWTAMPVPCTLTSRLNITQDVYTFLATRSICPSPQPWSFDTTTLCRRNETSAMRTRSPGFRVEPRASPARSWGWWYNLKGNGRYTWFKPKAAALRQSNESNPCVTGISGKPL